MATIHEVQAESARRQSLFRDVNDRIRALVTVDPSDYLCECVRVECVERMQVSLEAYERVRDVATWFLVKPGHVLPEVERVTETHDAYVVVEKFGLAGSIAHETDPRRRPAGES
jgi:hypothetical protein